MKTNIIWFGLGAVLIAVVIWLQIPKPTPPSIQWLGTMADGKVGIGLRSDGVIVWTNVIWYTNK